MHFLQSLLSNIIYAIPILINKFEDQLVLLILINQIRLNNIKKQTIQ